MSGATEGIWRGEYRSVQYLRGLAAVGVVYFHTKVYLSDVAWPFGRQFGYGGVDLFFVISGFIMTVTTWGRTLSPLDFYVRRFIRVAPLYWGATLLSAAIFLVAPGAFIKQSVSVTHVILSLLFIPHHVAGEAGAAPFFKIGWTLNFEMFFYAVFGASLLIGAKELRLAIIAVLFGGLVVYGAFAQPTGALLGYYTSPFILEFLFGCAIGYAARTDLVSRATSRSGWLGIATASAIALSFGGAQGDGFARTAAFGIPAAMIVACLTAIELNGDLKDSRVLERLGNASYSIYLTHPFVLTGFKLVLRRLDLPSTNVAIGSVSILFAVVISMLAGYAVYLLVEHPLLRAMQARVGVFRLRKQSFAGTAS